MTVTAQDSLRFIPTDVLIGELDRRTRENIAGKNFYAPMCLSIDSYQDESMRNYHQQGALMTEREAMFLAVLGIAGEMGEVAELVKKHRFHEAELDVEKLTLEVGDVIWYCVLLLHIVGVPFRHALDANVRKLRKRFPGDWSATAQRAKADANG